MQRLSKPSKVQTDKSCYLELKTTRLCCNIHTRQALSNSLCNCTHINTPGMDIPVPNNRPVLLFITRQKIVGNIQKLVVKLDMGLSTVLRVALCYHKHAIPRLCGRCSRITTAQRNLSPSYCLEIIFGALPWNRF